jgi:hypothetical protein
MDADSLGRSLHQVGVCYAGLGRSGEAQQCFERATTCWKTEVGT